MPDQNCPNCHQPTCSIQSEADAAGILIVAYQWRCRLCGVVRLQVWDEATQSMVDHEVPK